MKKSACQLASRLLVVLLISQQTDAFVSTKRAERFGPESTYRGAASCLRISLQNALGSTAESTEAIKDLKLEIEKEIKSTKRGLSATPEKKAQVDALVQKLESLCPYDEPARMPDMEGKWIVDYTTAPPPSNGKLGPFVGIARQIINLDDGTYVNYLSVPGDIEKEFLSAKLVATFEEWDGKLLKDDRIEIDDVGDDDDNFSDSSSNTVTTPTNWVESISSIFKPQPQQKLESNPDYGADSWKVDFKTLTIKLFGFKLIEKSFDEGTSRVWKMSYLDKDGTRVVRAGRTGKDEDAMLFYMQKE